MTKKDYIDIAQQISRTIADVETETEAPETAVILGYLDRLVVRLANVCENDNPRFDRDRFWTACNDGREVN